MNKKLPQNTAAFDTYSNGRMNWFTTWGTGTRRAAAALAMGGGGRPRRQGHRHTLALEVGLKSSRESAPISRLVGRPAHLADLAHGEQL